LRLEDPSHLKTTMDNNDSELVILENIYLSQKRSTEVKQRDLAIAAGLSLGMTNAILKRFSDKGWVSVRKLNSRNILYAVTPDGINEIARRTFGYFKRTIKNVAFYKEVLEELLIEKKRDGFTGILLVGISDLEFIVEHICLKYGIFFLKTAIPESARKRKLSGKYLYLYSETLEHGIATEMLESPIDSLWLIDVLTRNPV